MSHFDETSGLSVGAPPEGQKDDDTVKGRTSAWENQVTESTDHAIPPVFCGMPLCSDTPVREPSTGDLALSTSIYHARPPVPSVMSMQSGQSSGELPTFRVESTSRTRVHHSRPPSSVSSVSLHSDDSMREPPGFAEELSQSTSAYTDRPGGVLCSTCPKRAFKSCLTCVASFCEHHVRQHYTAPALQRHKLVKAIEDLEERLCQQHYRELEFYCKTDQTPVCALCISRQHRGHDIEELSEHGKESELNLTPQMKESELTTQQNLPAPKPITFKFVKTDSVCLSWGAPEGLTRPEFAVTWRSEVDSGNLIVPGQEVDIQNLTPGEMYTFSVATLYDGSQSVCVSETVRTEIPAPEDIKLNATLTSVSVSWSKPEGVDEVSYLLTLSSGGGYMKTVNTKSLQCCFSDLEVGTEYSISASTVQKKGFLGKPILKTIIISVPVPEELKVVSVSASSANLTWSPPHGMGQIPHSFLVSYSSDGTEKSISTDSCSTDIMHLQPGTDYTVRVQTKLKNERLSEALRVEIQTVVPAPDKLKVVSVRVTSASLTWSPPHGMGQIPHSFLVTYSSDGTEKSILADSCSTEIMHLQPGTDYTVRVQTKLKNKRLSEAARAEIQTGEEELASTQDCYRSPFHLGVSCKKKITEECRLIKKGPPGCYLLPTKKSNINEKESVRKWTFGEIDQTKSVKNILVVGETGTGKTTLINTMVNYMLGVQWEHRVWYKITEEPRKSQAKSQTTAITVYEVFVKTFSVALRIIDTPGYGSTDGIERDRKVAENLHMLFRSEDGIHEISAVGLVVKSGCNRLTDFQRYIFDVILSLFGKDMEKNIVVMITHSDGMSVEDIINVLNEDNVPCAKGDDGVPLHFIFNNRQSKTGKVKIEDMLRKAWDLGYYSLERFLVFLQDIDVKGLMLTEGVLRERESLEGCVYKLKDAIEMEELKQIELQQTQRALKENKEKCGNNEDFTYEVDEPYKDKVPIPWWVLSTKATCCNKCEENCHYPYCWWVKDLSKCSAMKNGKCTVCKNKCPVSNHVRDKTIYVLKTRRVKKTYEDLKKQHEKHVDIKKALEDEINASKVKKAELLEEAYQCIIQLENIALKKDSVFTLMHLDFLIEKMKEMGDDTKVEKLVNLNKQFHSSHKTRWVRWVKRLQNALQDRPKQQSANTAKDSQHTN